MWSCQLVVSSKSRQNVNVNLVGKKLTRFKFCVYSNFRSQALSDCDENQPFCLFCDQDRMNRFLCEREVVAETRQKLECMDRMQYFSSLTEEEFRNQESFLPLSNGYCK